MPRPKNKAELSAQSQHNFERLIDFIDSLPAEKLNAPFPEGYLNRNVRDVLAHLYHWHLMFQEWYRVGMKGEEPDIPAKGYSWKTTPELNQSIWNQYSTAELDDIRRRFKKSHEDTQTIISSHNDDELFTKKHYKWTGGTSLGAYLISATSSHYDWAYKLIKKCLK